MELRIDNNETSLLASGWMLSEAPLKKRVNIQQRYGKAGGYISGDREAMSRAVSIETDITSENDSSYIDQMGAIVRIFNKEKLPFYLVDTDNDRRAEIELDTITPSTKKGLEMIWTPIKLDVIFVETFWEDNTAIEVESESAGLASGSSLLCDNNGDVDCYPIITISPSDSNSAFSIINNTTNDIFTIGSTAFVPGTTLTIDSQEGTVYLSDGVSSIEISSSIFDGTGFLYLTTGENDIEYDSAFGAIDINISYRQRYAY